MTHDECIERISIWVNAKTDPFTIVENIRAIVSEFEMSDQAPEHPEPEDFDTECEDCHHSSIGCHERRCGYERQNNLFDYDKAIRRINELTKIIEGRR